MHLEEYFVDYWTSSERTSACVSNVVRSDLKFTIPLTVYCNKNLGYVLQVLNRTTIVLLQHSISDGTKRILISFLHLISRSESRSISLSKFWISCDFSII